MRVRKVLAGLVFSLVLVSSFGMLVFASDAPEPPPEPGQLPCVQPAYCGYEHCACGDEGTEACVCPDDCLCKTAQPHTCLTPNRCTNANCLCNTLGAAYCLCEDDCRCMLPDFDVDVATTVGNSTPASGATVKVDVNAVLNSTGASFSDIVFKTYVPSCLTVPELDIDTPQFSLVERTVEGEYTVISVHCSATGAAALQYEFDVYFPAGVTPGGTEAVIRTVAEGVVNDTWPITEALQNSIAATCTAQATALWDVDIKTVKLDYKDPTNDGINMFRTQTTVTRTPGAVEQGVLYLREEGTALRIQLPSDGENDILTVLRVVNASGTPVPYTGPDANGVITVQAADIPFAQGFAGTPALSSANVANVFVVFELAQDYLDVPGRLTDLGGGHYASDIEIGASFAYTLADGTTGTAKDDDTTLEVLNYIPAQESSGSIDKWAEPYIDGAYFFLAPADAAAAPVVYGDAVPIVYTLSYHNNSNTPVDQFVLTDTHPAMMVLENGSLTDATQHPDGDVNADMVYFSEVVFKSWNAATYAPGATAQLVVVRGGTETRVPIAPGDAVPLGRDVDSIRVEVEAADEVEGLRHGFRLALEVKVLGAPELYADADARKKVNYIDNTASYTVRSTKDHGVSWTSSAFRRVHVYPFDMEDPERVWTLNARVSSAAGGVFDDTVTLSRGREVFYKITVTPQNTAQHVYDPVFYLELPPEVQFDAGAQNAVVFSGAVAGEGIVPRHHRRRRV